jgi:hypothetical protein
MACGRELQNVTEDAQENQPYNGTAFRTHGHYGSTIYDPMDGRFLEINICDTCLASHPERAMEGRDRRPIMENGTVLGWEKAKWNLTPWTPSEREISFAIEVMRKERGELGGTEEVPSSKEDV